VLKNDVNLETSSAFDINLIQELYDQGLIDKDIYIICNGYKRQQYIENIAGMIQDGFHNMVPVIDNKGEIDLLNDALLTVKEPVKIGVRIASEEEPKFDFYTSRLGIRYNDIVSSGLANEVLDAGREKANKIANEKYEQVRKLVGFGR
jgi:arginine decarboxylase